MYRNGSPQASRGRQRCPAQADVAHRPESSRAGPIHVDGLACIEGPDKELGAIAPLAILDHQLFQITLVVQADKVKRLQQVPIWLDRTHGKLHPAQYHPAAEWLKENGFDAAARQVRSHPGCGEGLPAQARPTQQSREQPWMVLHELSHAYHDQVLGFDNAEIKAAWQHFVDSGKYKSVLHMNGHMRPHYGLTNPHGSFSPRCRRRISG